MSVKSLFTLCINSMPPREAGILVRSGLFPRDYILQSMTKEMQIKALSKHYEYKGDKIIGSCEYKKSKKHGVEKRLFGNGDLKSVIHYSNGKKNGDSESYSKSGICYMFCQYKDDVLNGKYVKKSEDGICIQHSNFVNGLREGEEIKRYDNGIISSKCQYKRGKRHGQYDGYNALGKQYVSIQYKNGLKHGEYKDYSGGVVHTTYYYNDLPMRQMDYIACMQEDYMKIKHDTLARRSINV